MRAFRTLLLTVVVLVTTACASNAVKPQGKLSEAEVPYRSVAVTNSQPDTESIPTPASPTSQVPASTAGDKLAGSAVAEAPSQTELEPQAQELIQDPWEGFNRKMHSFNNAADEYVLRPLAVGYKKITPEPIQAGISRFFSNLGMPVTAVNQALQGRPGAAGKSIGRFAVNTTIGVVGVFDPASHFGIPAPDDEDFGQTFATWGWRDSRYLVLPLLGPRTVRDAIGFVGDRQLSLIGQIQDADLASGLQVLEMVDVRKQMLPLDKFRRDAFDDYLFVRDTWTQHRNNEIEKNLQ